jgi:hypothetical protein
MVEIVAGDPEGSQIFSLDRLPLSVGRRSGECLINRTGVWDGHIVLSRDAEGWIVATPHTEAAVFRGGEQLGPATRIKNGDGLDLGSARLLFRISPPRQRTLRMLETFTWSGLVILVVAQILLMRRF